MFLFVLLRISHSGLLDVFLQGLLHGLLFFVDFSILISIASCIDVLLVLSGGFHSGLLYMFLKGLPLGLL